MAFDRQPVPALPVADVELAQEYYREVFGCDIAWITDQKDMGAVSSGESVFFLRKTDGPFESFVQWVFTQNIDERFQQLEALGARIVEPPEMKPWGLLQFTVSDLDGNLFCFYLDQPGASGAGAAGALQQVPGGPPPLG